MCSVLLHILIIFQLHLVTSETIDKTSKTIDKMSKIRGYAIFHRHGHRAPSENIMKGVVALAGNVMEIESDMWRDLVTVGNMYVTPAASAFPIRNNNRRGSSIDAKTFPFGHLTVMGVLHLRDVGDKISALFPLLRTVKMQNIEAYSTNYDRTKASAQMLLYGLLKPASRSNSTEKNTEKKGIEEKSTVEVQIRDHRACPMSFYDDNGLTAKYLFKQAQSTEKFLKRQQKPYILTAETNLDLEFPSLYTLNNTHADKYTPFKWLNTFDYFVCREAHGMPLNEQIGHLSVLVHTHIAARYNDYYTDMEHLSLVAVPLLMDLLHALQRRNKENSSTDSASTDSITTDSASTDSISTDSADLSNDVRLSVFSGHDVTILPLLYALKASVIVHHDYDKGNKICPDTGRQIDEEFPYPKNESYWPAYGSTLIFEYVDTIIDDKQTTLINAYLDLAPVSLNIGDKESISFTEQELINRIDYLKQFILPEVV